MSVNKVGLEAEYLLKDTKDNILFPEEYELDHDDFPILGEIRGEPGTTREETLANFMKEFFKTSHKIRKLGLVMDISGFAKITPEFHAKILRQMGTKQIAKCENIYPDTDILSMSDEEIVDGKIVSRFISCGLHVHFSSREERKREVTQDSYNLVVLPKMFISEDVTLNFGTLYKKAESKVTEKIELSCDRITNPVIKYFVQTMDETLLVLFKSPVNLKYRNPGFWERKYYGFEYRSLPFNEKTFSSLQDITDVAFSLLEKL